MVNRAETLLTQGNRNFEQVQTLRSLQQELANNFYPERADFTTTMNLGADFCSHLTTSFPLKVRRDLANIFSTMLRPQDKLWAVMSTRNYESLDEEGKRWLEMGSKLYRNAIYDQDSGFARATSQGDDDIAVFGQAVFSCEMNWRKQALLFRNWHLRDVVWNDDADGTIGRVDRRWRPCALDLNMIFKGNVHDKVKKCLDKEPYREFEVRHIFIPSDDYDIGTGNRKFKYTSVFYDVENKFIMEEVPYKYEYYAIPRWKTISGSQYAYSPAAMASLPDARLIQDMMLVILEAGQKAVDPPMIQQADVLRSDANLFSGGITVVDSDYDERLGRPLYPVMDSRTSNVPMGVELMEAVKQGLVDTWYINKVGLPPMGSGMSPMEVNQRVSEYVRGALPLFEPLEPEYNGNLMNLGFNVAMAHGFFGPANSIPDSLLGKNVEFKFNNPLRESMDRAKGNMLLESTAVLNQLSAYDPTVALILDAHTTARDTIDGIGSPRKWFKSEEQVAEEKAQKEQQAAAAETMAAVQAGAVTAEQLGKAGTALQGIQQ